MLLMLEPIKYLNEMNIKGKPLIGPIQPQYASDNLHQRITQLRQFLYLETLAPQLDLIQVLPVVDHEDVLLRFLTEPHLQVHSDLSDEGESDEVRFRGR